MAAQQDTIDRALEFAATGRSEEALLLLRPMIRDDVTRDQALFALAYCFERADNLPTAAYLYDWIVQHHPEFNVAQNRLSTCRAEMEKRGLTEDFEDAGHVACPCGLFRQRAEYGACPYCGRLHDATGLESGALEDGAASEASPPETQNEEVATLRDRWGSEELGATVEKLQEIKKEAAARLRELSDTEPLKRVSTKAGELAREASSRLEAFTESDAVQDAAKKTKEMGRDTSSAVKRFFEKPEVQDARTKVAGWAKEIAADTSDWVKSERVQAAAKKTVKTSEAVLARIQALIDRMKK